MKASAVRRRTPKRRGLRTDGRPSRRQRRMTPVQHTVLSWFPIPGWTAEAWSYLDVTTRHIYVRVCHHQASTTLNFRVPR